MKPDVIQFDTVVVHYDEIGLKGNNRGQFERLLNDNIQNKLGAMVVEPFRESGQITVSILDQAQLNGIRETFQKIPGIAYFSLARGMSLEPKKLAEDLLALVAPLSFSSFRIDTHRHHKEYPMTSMALNALLREAVKTTFKKSVNLSHADLTIKVEITARAAYVSFENVEGVGGLPTDPHQKVMALLSGGIDSPVAAYLLMKRGCEVQLIHFQNQNMDEVAVEDKIHRLAKKHSEYQCRTKLIMVSFEEIQRRIIKEVDANIRMLVYRKMMLEIASQYAAKVHARFLVVGDCMAQVASQTYDNLFATYQGSALPVLTPLIGMDKKEITEIAKKIGTFSISSLPYGDCCSYFIDRHPELRMKAADLASIFSKLDVTGFIQEIGSSTKQYTL